MTRTARTARVAEQVIREFDEAVARATGDLGEPGPVCLEIPADHPSFAGAVRAAVVSNAGAVIVIGRKLDYQLGYGSPADPEGPLHPHS